MKNIWQQLDRPIIALAPMAGITDSPFRQICKSFGADLVYTEMISACALAYGSKKTLELMRFDKKEKPIILQLFGKDPGSFKKAIENWKLKIENFSGIDINMGCPAKKVVKSGHGVALMKNPKLASEIVAFLKKSTKLPISVKTRLGFKNKDEILSFGPRLEKAGADSLCVHARTYKQGFKGLVDLEIIKKLKLKLKIPLIISGGIYSPEKAKETLDITQADGIMIAQGSLGKPWIFKQIKEYLKFLEGDIRECRLQNGKRYDTPTWPQIKKTALKHAALAYKTKEDHGIIEMRKHLGWYVKERPDAKELRRKLVRAENLKDIKEILK